ncbi:hypothetical protein, partial [Staphylococcus hominis]|uniref:hypothetical protein n=1 Tax=Staphylococcus hominis TaxID=1290 RepID=UPI003BF9C41B
KKENINTTNNNAINITIGMMMKKKESTPRLNEAIIALIIFRRLGVTLALDIASLALTSLPISCGSFKSDIISFSDFPF